MSTVTFGDHEHCHRWREATMNKVLAIGHRGAPTVATENTLPSIEAALEAGADWVEIDIKLTRDRVPVLLHDHTLHRIWAMPAPIGDVDRTELPSEIPTLREALDCVHGRGTRLLIDLTGVEEGAASIDLVRDIGRLDEAAFTGDTDALARVRAQAPDAIITMTWESLDLPGEDVLARVRPQYINEPHELLDERIIGLVHDAGLKVSTYTVDDADRMRWLAANGVDAITSNRIDTLVSVLNGG
jgi:glycerophosphoryl diester phosphodiesterase